jgi:hypothetical protein
VNTLTAWDASAAWTSAVVLLAAATIILACLSKSNDTKFAAVFGLAVTALGISQAIVILLFNGVGVSKPFPADSEVIDGHRVTLEFGLLTAGQVAVCLSLAVAGLGALAVFSAFRHRKGIATSLAPSP